MIAKRKPIAERLYRQGFTMETIATQLGVHHSQIVRDLKDICGDRTNVKDRGTDTLGRKKSTGRPKDARTISEDPRGFEVTSKPARPKDESTRWCRNRHEGPWGISFKVPRIP
jgi:hypothetical protein